MPRYKTCCCFDARTGAMILGILGVLCSGFYFISNSVGLGVYAPQIEDVIDEYKQQLKDDFENQYESEADEAAFEKTMAQLDYAKALVPWLFIADILGAAFEWIVNAALLYGIGKSKAAFMLPWLIMHMAGIVFGCFFVTIGFFVISLGTPGGIISALILVLIALPFLAIPVYFWLVVRSVYLDIRESARTNDSSSQEEFDYGEKGGKYVKI